MSLQAELKVLVAEDDQVSRSVICRLLKDIPQVRIVGEAASGEEMLHLVFQEEPDVVFVDIDMPQMDGFTAAKECRQMNSRLNIIFTTGHTEFAVEAFELSAVDYLVKPIDLSKLMRSLDKVKFRMENRSQNLSQVKRLSIKVDGVVRFFNVSDIIFIEKNERKVMIHTREQVYEIYETLGSIHDQLPYYFFRTHRAYVVNTDYAEKILSQGDSYLLHFNDYAKYAYVARSHLHALCEMIKRGKS